MSSKSTRFGIGLAAGAAILTAAVPASAAPYRAVCQGKPSTIWFDTATNQYDGTAPRYSSSNRNGWRFIVGGGLLGTSADDVITGSAGPDTIFGLDGNDRLCGWEGDDDLSGGAGNDFLYGGEGNDSLRGGDGKDYLDGGPGDDNINGGSGDDKIAPGPGADQVIGGTGTDTVVVTSKSGTDQYVKAEATVVAPY